ncbi:MAG: hypothetical protein C0170_02720 [Hydrogenobaculum sp.]|nr:MAG: hypothetical protein C0194_01155 [Hydrogenobaculum sp.]PMP92535.1 MAG: hypothetical protein C0170_02720 [Hydrogenobaculum sp.]
MRRHKFFIFGFLLSILIHLSFLLALVKINIPFKKPNKPVYISTIKQVSNKRPSKKVSNISKREKRYIKKQKIMKKSMSKAKNIKKDNYYKPNYNLAIPTLQEATLTSKQKTHSTKISSKGSIKRSYKENSPEKGENQEKNQTNKSKTTKSSNTASNIKPLKEKPKSVPQMKPKNISTLGSYFDFLSYLENVFHYIHQNCKGEGVLMFDLYKDGSLKLLETQKGSVTCEKNLQAPPMPSSVMENKIQFLINIP